jgi:hypothetical protein
MNNGIHFPILDAPALGMVCSYCLLQHSCWREWNSRRSIITSFSSVGMVQLKVARTSWRDETAKPNSASLWDWMGTSSLSCIFNVEFQICLFPFLLSPPFFSWLVSPFPRHRDPKENWVHISPEFQSLMEECSLSNVKILTTIQEMWRIPISQHVFLVHCVFLSLDLSISLGILEFQIWHPSKKTQYWNTYNGKKKTKLVSAEIKCHWKINVQFTMDQTNVERLD